MVDDEFVELQPMQQMRWVILYVVLNVLGCAKDEERPYIKTFLPASSLINKCEFFQLYCVFFNLVLLILKLNVILRAFSKVFTLTNLYKCIAIGWRNILNLDTNILVIILLFAPICIYNIQEHIKIIKFYKKISSRLIRSFSLIVTV